METKKLTAKDLMVGDWVNIYHFTNDEQQVKDLFPAKVVSILQGNEKENYNTIECVYGTNIAFRLADTCLPIPLTAEIFEKNGFKNIDTGLDCDGSNIYWKTNNGYSINTQDINLNFVHELQHALRLCGINKEITL